MPAAPKLAGKAASRYKFRTFEEMAQEASESVGNSSEPFPLTLGPDDVVEIPCPNGESYLRIVEHQRRGQTDLLLEALIPDAMTRGRLIAKSRGVPFAIWDTLVADVLRYFYGLGLQAVEEDEDAGNSEASST